MKLSGYAAGALICVAGRSAFAQGTQEVPPLPATNAPPSTVARDVADVLTARVPAPRQAFELGAQAGYTQGFGALTTDPRIGAGPGAAIGISLDDRFDPHWSAGVAGQFQAYGATGAPNMASLRGMTVDVHGTYHFAPYNRLDPNITFGGGYRLFAESPPGDTPTTFTHGLELGKVEVGLDVRASDSIAISPVIGADLSLFAWRAGGGIETATLTNKTLSTFLFAGVRGRFDIGGAREARAPVTVGQR
jgi:hypothetical protein